MNLDRFREFYERFGFWRFWFNILVMALVAYGIFLVFTKYVGPYVVGLWLAGVIG